MIKFKIQKEKKINFGGRSNKVAQYMTDNDHVCRNKREDSWNFSESRYLISSKKIQRDDNNMQTHINSNNDHNIKES